MIGQTLSRYRILEKLGEGGMGVVYKAHDSQLGRPVALKLLPPEEVRDERRRRRFYDEARSASALNHPNIATIYEIGEAEGTHFIAMEFVEGETLRRLLSRGRQGLKRALEIALQVAEALTRAHAAGIVHRDIKPENIIVTPEGLVKVLDFGLAKRTEAAVLATSGASTLPTATDPGTVLGTVAYMSPEQAQGKPVDARSDIFSFGAVFYEMLAGQQPFKGESSVDVLHAIVRSEPRPLTKLDPTLPSELSRILEKCLAKDPEERYQVIKDLAIDLKRLKRDTDSGVEPVAPVVARPTGRWWLAAVAAAGVVAALLVGLYLLRARQAQAPGQAGVIKPLTSLVGLEWAPSWSPDGSFIAYSHTKYGHLDVFVVSTAGGDPIRLTQGLADDSMPRWSPDGRYVAFLSDHGTGTDVYLIPPLGGAERKLVETHIPHLERTIDAWSTLGAMPWSPDAQELLFSRLAPTGEIAVWKLNLTTGQQAQLTQPTLGTDDLEATGSFNGEWIAFQRRRGGRGRLWVLPARGGVPYPLLEDEYNNGSPAWSADNKRIVFTSTRGGAENLWEIEVQTKRLRQLTSGPGRDWMPVIARNGVIAYSQWGHQIDVYAFSLANGTDQRLTSHTHDNYGARASPDGTKIAYHSNRTGNFEIWLLEPKTGAEQQLTNHPAQNIGADWSPDGRQIVFLSNREGPFQLWVMNAEGGALRRLTDQAIPVPAGPSFSQSGRWSPDGKLIGYLAPSEKGLALWTVEPDGQNPRPRLFSVVRFDWYRDSRHVIYTRTAADGSGTLEMRVADLESGKGAILLKGPSAELAVARDGSAVSYCHAPSHLDMQLYVLRLAPPASPGELPRPLGKPQQLTRGEGRFHAHNSGWSPDGKSLLYSRDADQGDIYLLQNYR